MVSGQPITLVKDSVKPIEIVLVLATEVKQRYDTLMNRIAIFVVFAGLTIVPASSDASQGEKAFSFSSHYTLLMSQEARFGTNHGVGIEATFWYGAADTLNLLTAISYDFYGRSNNRNHVVQLSFLPTFVVDALEWVIAFPAGFGARYSRMQGTDRFGAQLIAGATVDYRPKRNFSVGIDLRFGVNLVDFETFPATFRLGFRATVYWE